jgi:hypothetical protein
LAQPPLLNRFWRNTLRRRVEGCAIKCACQALPAVLFSISCNGAHGLPRTNADKRKAVTLLLADAEWSPWSDRKIARRCQVSHEFVHQLRRSCRPPATPWFVCAMDGLID